MGIDPAIANDGRANSAEMEPNIVAVDPARKARRCCIPSAGSENSVSDEDEDKKENAVTPFFGTVMANL